MLRECYPHQGPVYTNRYACYKSKGPIIIHGLSSFNSTKFIVSENEGASPDGAEIKEITAEIKTNHLKATTTATCTDTTTSLRTTSSFERDWFAEISVRDVVSSRINENEKIDKKIIDTVAQHASNCNTYSKLDLPTEGFTFPKSSITVDLGSANATFYGIRISRLSPIERKSYSTSIKCYSTSTRMAEVSLDIAKQFQILIHNKLQIIFDEVESFLTEKFNVEFANTFISVANDSTKFINTDKIVIQDYVSGFQNMIDDLYRIPNRDLNMLRECYPHEGPVYTDHHACYKSKGPFIINGLSSFNSTKFIVSENGGASPDDAEIKEITVEIKTNHLKSKVDYLHHSEPNHFFHT
ncbi:hypothetical protein U1Q18_048142 [Sarracenia purpurea var. burkii]